MSCCMDLLTTILAIGTFLSLSPTQIVADESYTKCTYVQKERITYIFDPSEWHTSKSLSFYTRNRTDEWTIEVSHEGVYAGITAFHLHLVSSKNLNTEVEFSVKGLCRPFNESTSSNHFEEIYKTNESKTLVLYMDWDNLMTCFIHCHLAVVVKSIDAPCDRLNVLQELLNSQEHKLADDLRLLYKNMNSSDVTIITESQIFPAHKAILTARSSILAELLEQNKTKENCTNVITINNMTSAEVRGMLEFIYTDNVTNLQEAAHGFLVAADRYKLRRLKTMCEEVLHKELNIASAADLLMFSHSYHADALKKSCSDFIAEHLALVALTEGYKRMTTMYPELLNEIIQSIISKSPK